MTDTDTRSWGHMFIAEIIETVRGVPAKDCQLGDQLYGERLGLESIDLIEISMVIEEELDFELNINVFGHAFHSINDLDLELWKRDSAIVKLMAYLNIELDINALDGRDPHDPAKLAASVRGLLTVGALANFVDSRLS